MPSSIVPGTWYNLRIDLKGGKITVYWNEQQIVTCTDTSPWTNGKIGFRQNSNRVVRWDNIFVWKDESPDVVAYDDYYPFGSIMPNRSSVSSSDARFKFTGKERDAESGYDYFGARYYDSRIGRWLQVDPLDALYPGLSPYNYCKNNPLSFIDPKGMADSSVNEAGIEELVIPAGYVAANTPELIALVRIGSPILIIGGVLYVLINYEDYPDLKYVSPGLDMSARVSRPVDWGKLFSSEGTKEGTAAEKLPDMSGKSHEEAKKELEAAGFEPKSKTAKGYEHYKHPDGSQIVIRPDGEVVRLNPKVTPTDGGKKYHPHVGSDGQPAPHNNTGEKIIK